MTMQPRLLDGLEQELDEIRADPGESVGSGDKSYLPYEPNVANFLITSDDPDVTRRLVSEIDASDDRVYRLALLQVLGRRPDDGVDPALIRLMDDPDLRATSAYLLGRAGFKGYPARHRDAEAVLEALRRRLADDTTFADPFRRRSFRTQDFVLGAFVRVAGPDRFRFPDPRLADNIGYDLPSFDDATREDLLAQANEIDVR